MAFVDTPSRGINNEATAVDLNALFPEFRKKAAAAYGDQWAAFYEIMTAMGYMVPVAQETYNHWEDLLWVKLETVKIANSGAGAGAPDTVRIQEDANNQVYMRPNDILILPDGVRAVAQSETVVSTDHDFVLIPLDPADSIAIMAPGDEITIEANAHGEGSDQPDARKITFLEDGGRLQVYKETVSVTGTAKTDQLWFSGSAASGAGDGRTLWHLNQPMVEYRLKLQMQQSFLTGTEITNAAASVDADGNLRRGTEGAVEYAQRRGNTLIVAPSGVSLATFDEIEDYSVKQRAEGTHLTISGTKRGQEYNTLFKTQFSDSNIPQVEKALMANDYMSYRDLSLQSIVRYKLLAMTRNTYLFSNMGSFDHPNTYNTTALGPTYQNISLFLPFGMERDPMLGSMNPYWGYAFKNYDGYSRKMEIWTQGTAKPSGRIGSVDDDKLYGRATQGTHFSCGNRWQIMLPA